ncbi:Alpha/beta hydrolase family protein [Candidatus Izimaplasma bacterium HR1]|jgi:predicted transcriptional regulator|uniref:hypothetical protein n=1 Tax=Candidatus Izimoplasma sp. HR1 TaxID=1541959 RepID=UPI0004F7094C|nr:Alpha/beta hydrolase family protein [Candidatus Izimaplasma bacterium HR1]
MSPISLIEIERNNMKSNHKLYANENGNSLVVVFPGGGNSCDRPLLQYLRSYFLNENFDVLCASYRNLFRSEETSDEIMDSIADGVNNAINEVSKGKDYKDIIFISRSAGNLASSKLRVKHSINVKKSIYISPTVDAIEYINEYPGIVVTASNDTYLNNDEVIKLSNSGKSEVIVFKDGNHGLETENTLESMDFHKLAMSKIIEYYNK